MHRPLRTTLCLLAVPIALAMSGLVATGASASPGSHDRRGPSSSKADDSRTPSLIDQLAASAHHGGRHRGTGSGVQTVITGLRNPRAHRFRKLSTLALPLRGRGGGPTLAVEKRDCLLGCAHAHALGDNAVCQCVLSLCAGFKT